MYYSFEKKSKTQVSPINKCSNLLKIKISFMIFHDI